MTPCLPFLLAIQPLPAPPEAPRYGTEGVFLSGWTATEGASLEATLKAAKTWVQARLRARLETLSNAAVPPLPAPAGPVTRSGTVIRVFGQPGDSRASLVLLKADGSGTTTLLVRCPVEGIPEQGTLTPEAERRTLERALQQLER